MATQLFGKADAALANAAYKAAQANAPTDLAPIHARMAASYKTSIDSTAEVWKKGIKEAGDVAVKLREQVKLNRMGFEETSDFGIDGEDLEFSHTDINNNTVSVKAANHEELLKLVRKEKFSLSLLGGSMLPKEDKKARRKKLNEIQDNIRASTKGFLVFKERAEAMIDSGSYNSNATKGKGQMFLHALLANGKPLSGGQRAVMGWTEKGIMTFAFVDKDGKAILDEFGKEMTIQQGDVDNYLTPNYDDGRTAISVAILNAGASGAKGDPHNQSVLNNLVKNTITTRAQFSDLANWSTDNMEATLADKLHGIKIDKTSGMAVNDETLLSELIFSNLDIAQWDTIPEGEDKGDGIIDGNDFSTTENYEKLLSAILNPKNPDFDLELSNKILAMHFGESASELNKEQLDRYNTGGGNDNAGITERSSRQARINIDTAVDGGVSFRSLMPSASYDYYLTDKDGNRDINGEYYTFTAGGYGIGSPIAKSDKDGLKAVLYQINQLYSVHKK